VCLSLARDRARVLLGGRRTGPERGDLVYPHGCLRDGDVGLKEKDPPGRVSVLFSCLIVILMTASRLQFTIVITIVLNHHHPQFTDDETRFKRCMRVTQVQLLFTSRGLNS
jgi:hypothetical protein